MVYSFQFWVWLVCAIFIAIIFIYSLIFLITVPKNLKKISAAVERIACALEKNAYNNEDHSDEW